MADVPNRDELEAKLARAIAKALGKQHKEIVAALGDPPDLSRLTAADWARWGKELSAAIGPELQSVFLAQAQVLLADVPSGVDWGLVNRQAVDWARGYAFDLVKGINDNSRATLQSAVGDFFAQGQTIGDVEKAIAGSFSPVRAATIARTEITRAAVEGEAAIAQDLTYQGIVMTEIWQTRDDEKVCPLCGPLDGKERGEGWQNRPPRHPNCRCWTTHELPKVRKAAAVKWDESQHPRDEGGRFGSGGGGGGGGSTLRNAGARVDTEASGYRWKDEETVRAHVDVELPPGDWADKDVEELVREHFATTGLPDTGLAEGNPERGLSPDEIDTVAVTRVTRRGRKVTVQVDITPTAEAGQSWLDAGMMREEYSGYGTVG